MGSNADRRATLATLIQALGDVPPAPSVNGWELARIDAEIRQCIERGEHVPESLVQERTTLAAGSTSLGMESGTPLLASPFLQSIAVDRVNELRAAVDGGDGGAVLEAVASCLAHGLVVPGWLAAEFVVRVDRVAVGDAKSWSEPDVFGPAIPAGINVSGVRARKQLGPRAYNTALQLIAAEPTTPIDKGFFERVGDLVGRSATATETLIREHIASGSGAWPPLAELKPFLIDAQGELGPAWAAWSDAKSLATWRAAGRSDADWIETFGREPRAAVGPKNCDDFQGLQA